MTELTTRNGPNPFEALSRYRKRENQLTAALMFLIETLLRDKNLESQKAALDVLDFLAGTNVFRWLNPNEVDFLLQYDLRKEPDDGEPGAEKARGVVDVRIEAPQICVFLEVKDRTEEHDQLPKYREGLNVRQNLGDQVFLVALARSKRDFRNLAAAQARFCLLVRGI